MALVAVSAGAWGCSGDAETPAPAARQSSTGDGGVLRRESRDSTVEADSLANTQIGGSYGTVLAFRFRARWTGEVRGVRFYVVLNSDGRAGYSDGSGGTLRVSLARDSGGRRHVPVRPSLASGTLDPPSRDAWPLVRFEKPGHVVADRDYYVVFTNVDPDPRRNYVSVNALVSHGHRDPAPHIPDGLTVLLAVARDGGRTPGRWHPRVQRRGDRYTPILEVVGGQPGQHLGVGYMEVWVNNPKPIGGGAMVRQLLAPAAGRAITGAWLRVRRREGASAPLQLRIERPGGGVLASGSVPSHAVRSDGAGWVHVRFPRPVTAHGRERLALTAAATAASAYEAFAIRQGTEFGFDQRTVFDGGYAQFTDGGAWVGWDQWGGHDQRNGDLQFAVDMVKR